MQTEVFGAGHRRYAVAIETVKIAMRHLIPDESRTAKVTLRITYHNEYPKHRLLKQDEDLYVLNLPTGQTLEQDIMTILTGCAGLRQWVDGDRKGLPNTLTKVRWKGEVVSIDSQRPVNEMVANPVIIDSVGRATILYDLLHDEFHALIRRAAKIQE